MNSRTLVDRYQLYKHFCCTQTLLNQATTDKNTPSNYICGELLV